MGKMEHYSPGVGYEDKLTWEANPGWYLVQCKPQNGFRAAEHLTRQGFQCFHPARTVVRRKGRRKRKITESLFPYYLFVHIKLGQSLSKVKYTRGVARIVGVDGSPLRVKSSVVVGVMRHCRAMSDCHTPDYIPGDSIVITDGCFKDLKGVFKARKSGERVVLLLNLISKQTQVTLPEEAIELRYA